jgi:tetratricopeptide (TPR) repeat protein
MDVEAERAYRQSLQLWEGSGESLSALTTMLWERRDFDGILAILGKALEEDPNNFGLWGLYFSTEKRQQMESRIAELQAVLESDQANESAARELLEIHASLGDAQALRKELDLMMPAFRENPGVLFMAASLAESAELHATGLEAARMLVVAEPDDAENQLLLARLAIREGQTNESLEAARAAVRNGGLPVREALQKLKVFEPLKGLLEFDSPGGS